MRGKVVVRTVFAAALGLICVQSVLSQTTFKASKTAIIEQNGPKTGSSGERYFNVEGKDKGKYSCYALVQFDAKAMLVELKKASLNGKAKLKQVRLDLAQSNASFSASGGVRVYYVPGLPDPKALKYPFSLQGSAKAIGELKFALVAGAKPSSREPLAAIIVDKCDLTGTVHANDLTKALASSPMLTLALVETTPGVAATWAGTAHKSLPPPTLVFTFVK